MKKKGFTLVELLGVIVILAIVLNLAVVTYNNSSKEIDVAYYKTIEESLLISGGDYFNYNKGEQPGVFGDEKRVTIKKLQDDGYIDDSVIDSEGNSCDLEKSYVGAYKDSIDKTNYYVCLTCGEYIKDEAPCGGKVSYALGVRANKKTSKDVYNPNGKNWANEDIVFTFETLNDMNTVVLENEAGNSVGSCNLKTAKGIKSCTIEVDKSENYKAYAKNGGKESRKQELKVLIDKVPPTFDIKEIGIKDTETNRNVIEVELKAGVKDLEKEVKNSVINIKDDNSGIKIVESSLEYDEDKDYYEDQGIVTNFNITKSLKLGFHHLKVRVYDKAGNKTEKEVDYSVYKNVVLPTFDTHCEDLTYNGKEQILTKEPEEGYTFENNKGTLADEYDVTIKLEENYRFSKEEKEDKILTCKIKQKPVTITAKPQTITYGDTFVSNDKSKVTVDELASGDTLNSIKLTPSTTNATTSGIITPSDAIIKHSAIDVTNSYKIIYKTGKLTINKAKTATTGSCLNPTYKAKSQTLASGGKYVTYTNNTQTNVGTYNVTVTADSNHLFSDGKETKTLSCKMNEAPKPTISFSQSDGTKYTNNGTCYTGKITIKMTCTSTDPIASFAGTTYNGSTYTASTSKQAYSASATCTTIYGATSTDNKSYTECTYSRHSSCGVSKYNYSGSFTCYSSNGANSYNIPCDSKTYDKSAADACGSHTGQDFGSCSRSAVYNKCYHA